MTSIGSLAFSGCLKLSSITIPNSVSYIGNYAFHYCQGLSSVTIGNSVISIGNDAFAECSALNKVIVKDIAAWCNIAFGNYSSNPLCYAQHLYSDENTEITKLVIPNSVTSIGNYVFQYCKSFTSITIPNSVATIEKSAFVGCSSLFEIISLIENPFEIYGKTSRDKTFDLDVFNNTTLYVPQGTINKYKEMEGWKDFLFIEEGSGTGGESPEVKQCAKPIIYYTEGNLSYKSDTEGVEFVTDFYDTDVKRHNGDNIDLTVTYHISVYATKFNYKDSEVAEATLCWIEVDPQKEGISEETATEAKQLQAMPVLIQANDGQISVEGAPEGTKVAVYDASGVEMGTAISRGGTTLIPTHLTSGSIAIVKIGEKAVKLAVK